MLPPAYLAELVTTDRTKPQVTCLNPISVWPSRSRGHKIPVRCKLFFSKPKCTRPPNFSLKYTGEVPSRRGLFGGFVLLLERGQGPTERGRTKQKLMTYKHQLPFNSRGIPFLKCW